MVQPNKSFNLTSPALRGGRHSGAVKRAPQVNSNPLAGGKNKVGRKFQMKENGMCGSIYGMAFIGAAVYMILHATSFWGGVLGIVEAFVWPAFLMYKLLEYLKL
jgi:hypothetical protein